MAAHTPPAHDLSERILRRLAPAPGQVVRLRREGPITPETADYVDLARGRSLGRMVRAVIEKDGSPLLYIAEVDAIERGPQLARLLANRAETASVLTCSSADTNIAMLYPCRLYGDVPSREIPLADDEQVRSVLGDLQDGLWASPDGAYLEQTLRDLLVNSVEKVSDELRSVSAIGSVDGSSNAVLGLVGRALFVRFLIDREILTPQTAPRLWQKVEGDWTTAFATPAKACATCEWLDKTFNGEFMPLARQVGYERFFESIASNTAGALTPLGWILARTEAGGQMPMWDRLDFSYIPAGTLSEVYEAYAHRESKGLAKTTSIHFTPRHIARMMVRQALMGLPEEDRASAKVLDPAVGAGVFLSVTFRELAKAHASAFGGWPDSEKLREILYGQLRGLDINGDALNLAALTLYLTAIELDANPLPPEKLHFRQSIIGSVLANVGGADAAGDSLGSLSESDPAGTGWDIVLGNPPWSSLSGSRATDVDDDEADVEGPGRKTSDSGDAFLRVVNESARQTLAERGIENANAYDHPDRVPDLAFVWKASKWAREGGVISFIVHHRLLIKRTKKWSHARQSLFAALQVDGILNASEFVNHEDLLWPGMEAPFCILFARNQRPTPGHRIKMLTMAVEPVLKVRRQIRLDPSASMWLSPGDFEAKPAGIIPRILGSAYDQNLLSSWLERMTPHSPSNATVEGAIAQRKLPMVSIGNYLKTVSSRDPRRGIKAGSKGAKVVPWMAQLPPGTRHFGAKQSSRGEINAADIHERYVARPQKSGHPSREWIEPPLLLMRQALGKPGAMARALVVTPDDDGTLVTYPFAYLGVPIKRDRSALKDAVYVALWMNSAVLGYFATMTSTQFAFGHKTVLNEDLMSCPIVPRQLAVARQLTSDGEIESLFARLSRGQLPQAELDAWVGKVMQLDEFDQEVIQDTLSVSYPIDRGRQSGTEWVAESTLQEYLRQLQRELGSAGVGVDTSSVRRLAAPTMTGWRFIAFASERAARPLASVQPLTHLDESSLLDLVRSQYPAGEIWGLTPNGECVFGQLALQRLWLPSRAPLAAQMAVDIVDRLRG